MAQASKMGADTATREARRAVNSGHICAKCGQPIAVGDLTMVQTLALDERGRGRKIKTPYHRSCFQ
jgi:hypothetical protein